MDGAGTFILILSSVTSETRLSFHLKKQLPRYQEAKIKMQKWFFRWPLMHFFASIFRMPLCFQK